MKRIVMIFILLPVGCNANGLQILEFIEKDFDTFVTQNLSEKDRERFKGYYATLQEQIKKETDDKQKKTREYLYSRGFIALDRDHNEWHRKIAQFVGPDYLDESYDADRAKVREFVYRHGALEEYRQARQDAQPTREVVHREQAVEKDTFVKQTKSYVAKATQKVSNWFRGFRTKTS